MALDDEGFTKLGPPEPGDWLHVHPETPQTVEDYTGGECLNRASPERRTITILPVGSIEDRRPGLIETVRAYAAAFFHCEAKALEPAAEGPPRSAWNEKRRQWNADKLLRWLEPQVPDDAIVFAAFLDEDLYSGDLNFVFGSGSLARRVGVYSTVRLDARGTSTLEKRTLNLAVHEIGHIFSIGHCTFYECVMNGSNSLSESDSRPMHLCPVDLEKLRWNVGFDPAARYEALERFYRARGDAYAAEAEFVAARRKAE